MGHVRPLTTRDDLLAALPDDPLLLQLLVRWAADEPAYALGGAVGLFHAWGDEADLVVVGDPDDAYDLAVGFHERHPDRRFAMSAPRAAGERLVKEHGLVEHEGWAYRWTATAPTPPVSDVGWLPAEAADEVRDVLTAGFPDASMPVGHPAVRRWAGLRRAGRLVAVAADATGVAGLGFLASIAGLPEVRGTGAGAAVTAWATAELVREEGRCGLWHMGDNLVAAALYTRLGFADDHRMAGVGPD